MSNVPPTYDDEIDLLNLIQTVWIGKWKILSIIAISLLSVFGFNVVKPNTTFTASTDIKPITSIEFDKYGLFNSSLKIIKKDEKEDKIFTIFEISQNSLLDLYIEQIEEGSLLETGIDKYNIVNKDNFKNESDYRDAVEKFASKIRVLKPYKEKKETYLQHVIKGEYDNKEKWKNLLTFINLEANRKVKASYVNRFATIVSVQNQKKEFAIKDIDTKIDNAQKDYERNIKDRLAFLAEQAIIARKLDVIKNTFVTNFKTDYPHYIRGYLAIEEEIKIIKNRENKKSFIKDLHKLEQQKRDLEQDKTIERAIDLFKKTPLNQNDFKATIVKVATTDFKINTKKNFFYTLALVLGSIIGVMYVLIANAFINRKTKKLNS